MTAAIPIRPPVLPRDARVVLPVALPVHLLALAALAGSWSSYRVPLLAVLIWLASVGLCAVLVAVPRRRPDRLLPRRTAAAVAIGPFVLAGGMVADLPAAAWNTAAAWTWATGAAVLAVLALRLAPAVTALLAVGYGGLGVGSVLLGGVGPWGVHRVLIATTVLPLLVAHYVRLGSGMLDRLTDASRTRIEATAPRADPDVMWLDDVRRLAALRDRIEPLLRDVAGRAPLPLDADRAALARRLADQLRSALAEQRRALWLPERAGTAEVDVVATDAAARAVADDDRAWVSALIDLLGTRPGWDHVRVVLDHRLDGSLRVVVTADGPAARAAADDVRLLALCADRPARCDAADGLLVLEAQLPTKIGA